MDNIDLAFIILESINLGITLLFLFVLAYRLLALKNLSLTEKYLGLYPKIRIILAAIYIVLSLALTIFNLIIRAFGDELFYLISGGIGQIINSILLLLQLVVLMQELRKEQPYTSVHLIYSIYLVVISFARFALTIIYLVISLNDSKQLKIQIVNLVVTTLLLWDSGILLGYWIYKRQQLPQFLDSRYFNFDQFRAHSSKLINKNVIKIDILNSNDQQLSSFPYIQPTVFVDKNNFKIVLQCLTLDKRNSLSQTSSARHSKTSKKLQIISNNYFSKEQINKFYIMCGRFSINTKINFKEQSLLDLSILIESFLSQLFQKSTNYQPFVLEFFKLPKQAIIQYSELLKGRSSFIKTQCSKIDENSPFISVVIFKNFWLEDHYEFYMRAVSSDEEFKTYPMKRYSDFEELDSKLRAIIKNNQWKLILPFLPKKHLFFYDEEKITQRRRQLQLYIRKLSNDSTIMSEEYPELRESIYKFLDFKNCLQINPHYNESYFENLDVVKGNINKALIGGDVVTYYEFKLFQNGIQIGTLNKRFSQFAILHKDIERWMNNIQITYTSIELPEKHLYKSQPHRHQKLRNYLRNVIQIRDAYKIYELAVFLNIAQDASILQNSIYSAISVIKTNSPAKTLQKKQSNGIKQQQEESPPVEIQIPQSFRSSYSSNQRMSKLIDQLGKNMD